MASLSAAAEAAVKQPPPPPSEATEAIVQQLLNAADNDAATATSTQLVDAVRADGISGLFSVMPRVLTAAAHRNDSSKFGALLSITSFCETMGTAAEPFLVSALAVVLTQAAARNGAVREKAEEAGHALMALLCPAVAYVLPDIFDAMQQERPWQTRQLAMKLLSQCVHTAPRQLAACLPEIVPQLTPCMTDTKKQVKQVAKNTMTALLTVVGNSDIEAILPNLVNCIIRPQLVPELMHELAAVVFVQTVDSPTLSVLVPLLVRGLREKNTATKRQTAVIINNMSKLVDNPIDSAPFLPLLLPALEKAADMVSDPEARNICERALAQLQRLNNACQEVGDVSRTDRNVVLGVLRAGLPANDDVLLVDTLDYLSAIGASLVDARCKDADAWSATLGPYLVTFFTAEQVAGSAQPIYDGCVQLIKEVREEEDEEAEDKEVLCDCEFTLAYGTKILLHNTKLKLLRGYRYGLLGANDSGKTTLMRSISQEQIEGFPPATELRTVFVEADILGELSHLSCVDYVLADDRIQGDGITEDAVREMLQSVHFTVKMLDDGVMTLSGGWRMKLALARAMLLRADILLLDEPTNHLDVMNVKWVKDYLNGLANVTSIIVSHDSGLLDECCTHVIHIDNLKLHLHKGNLSQFVQKVPEARSYFELTASRSKFTFPQPGPLQGVKSKGKALMKMEGVSYTYPGNDHHTITGITVQVSLSSRVGCVGPNGAGKSTMIKCLTGEVEPTVGTRWAHPNLRMAYVAQHAFHHIEQHLSKTPNEYIRWRYANGDDKEALNKVTMVITEEEQALMDQPFEFSWKDSSDKIQKAQRIVEKLTGMRRTNKNKEFEYEVKFRGSDLDASVYLAASKLSRQGWTKQMMAIDQKIAMMSGMYIRPLTTNNVEQHLEDVGLDREFGTHYRLGALSGGQKVKVVIGAAMWNQPHVVILDEPTNYLDRESLGALAGAIKDYDGGVVIITHNDEFCRALCPERWVLEKMGDGIGRLDCQGDPDWMKHALEQKVVVQEEPDEVVDAAGNVTKIVKAPKKLSRKEEKARKKAMAKKIKDGLELDSDEEAFAIEQGLM